MRETPGQRGGPALGEGAILALTELALPDALFVHDSDGRILEVNRRACVSLGFTREQLLRLTVFDFDSSFDRASAAELWRQAEPGRPQLVRTTHTRRDGSLFPVEVSFGVAEEQGRKLFVGIARDLTDRMARDHALRFAQERLLAVEREERQQAARLAVEAETRYRGIVQSMTEGMVLYAPDGRIVEANPAAERILGMTLDQLLGRTSLDPRWSAVREDGSPFPADEHPALTALRTGEVVHGVLLGIDDPQAGGRRWIRINAVPLRGAPGEPPAGVVTTFVDLTDLLALEERVAEFNRDFEGLLERTSDFVYFKDADGRFRFLSQALAEMAGHASWRELVGRRDVEVFPPRPAADGVEPEWPYAAGAPQLVGRVDPFPASSGRVGWVQTSTWPLVDEHGVAQGVFGIGRDVTAARRDEAALRLAASVFTHVREGIVILDAAGTVVDVNDAYLRLTGFGRGELIGRSCQLLHASPGSDTCAGPREDALRSVGTWSGEVDCLRRSGVPVRVRLTVDAVRDEAGLPQNFVCLYTGMGALLAVGRC